MSDAERKAELTEKVSALVVGKFGGDYKRAFTAYAVNDRMGADEVYNFLFDCGVGNRITRAAWVRNLIAAVDGDGDGKITFEELLKATNSEG